MALLTCCTLYFVAPALCRFFTGSARWLLSCGCSLLHTVVQACKNASRQKQAQMALEAKQAENGPPPQQLHIQLPAVQQLQAQMPLDPSTHTPLYAANLMAPHDPSESRHALHDLFKLRCA